MKKQYQHTYIHTKASKNEKSLLKFKLFTIFAIQNFVQTTKKTRKFHWYCLDHVCKIKE